MKKQYTLHLDALLVITAVYLLAFGFIAYQRYQYADLLEEHVQLQWKAQDMEVNVHYLSGMLQRCNESKQESVE